MVLKEEITHKFTYNPGLLHRFAGVDLAPNEQLETGFSAVDRDRTLVRMDKLYKDTEILAALESLGPLQNTVVVVDMPKSLSIPGRWRQEEIKMHPLRLDRTDGKKVFRFEERGLRLFDTLSKNGLLVLLYFNYWARVNYDMLIPFRSRSPQGCRALQSAIEHNLSLKNMPNNLAPSSVLESMVGAYASWTLWAGKPGTDFEIYQGDGPYHLMIPKARPHLQMPATAKRRRRFSRRMLRWFDSKGSKSLPPQRRDDD